MKIENIKFKAKRLDNGEWVEGSLTYFNGIAYIHHKESDEDDRCYLTPYEVNPDTVCQFTGLKDCEGNEVWEGDIFLDTIYGRLYTVMRYGYGSFFIRKNKSVNDDMYLFELIEEDKCIAFFEVIGNKFDKEK